MHHGILDHQSRQAVVGFHGSDETLHLQQPAETSAAHFRHGKLRPLPFVDLFVFIIRAVGEFHQFAAPLREDADHLVADRPLEAADPVVPVDHIVRPELLQDVLIAEGLLLHYAGDPGDVLEHHPALRGRHQRKAFVTGHRFIA